MKTPKPLRPYAGIAPSRGMTFPDDTVVYTVEQFPHHENDRTSRRQKVLRWSEQNEQILRKGFLTSRITSQILTARTGKSNAAVQLDQREAPTSLRNQLGGEIKLLLLCDTAGEMFTANNVPDGEKVSLTPADFVNVKSQLQRIFVDARPARPDGLDPGEFERVSMRRWRGWNLIDNGLSDPRMATGRLEDRLRWVQNIQEKDFPKATYIAVLASSSETPLGVRAREVGSLHIVEGKF